MKKAANSHLFGNVPIDDEEDSVEPRGPRQGVKVIVEVAPGGVLPKEDDPEIDGNKEVPTATPSDRNIVKNKLVSGN